MPELELTREEALIVISLANIECGVECGLGKMKCCFVCMQCNQAKLKSAVCQGVNLRDGNPLECRTIRRILGLPELWRIE